MTLKDVKRAIVRGMAAVNEALDEVLYRPAVVQAIAWLPRCWSYALVTKSNGSIVAAFRTLRTRGWIVLRELVSRHPSPTGDGLPRIRP